MEKAFTLTHTAMLAKMAQAGLRYRKSTDWIHNGKNICNGTDNKSTSVFYRKWVEKKGKTDIENDGDSQ